VNNKAIVQERPCNDQSADRSAATIAPPSRFALERIDHALKSANLFVSIGLLAKHDSSQFVKDSRLRDKSQPD